MLKTFPKILIIAFLATLLFQISSAEATESYQYYQKSLGANDCPGLKSGLTDASMESCLNTDLPPGCLKIGFSLSDLCFCCYYNSAPTQAPTSASNVIKFVPQVSGLTYSFNGNDHSTGNIAELIRAIYDYAIGIVGILAAVILMYGGVLWIVAGGNTTQVGEAKSWIGAALTGLILALTSYLILNTVNPALVNLKTTKIQTVAEMKEGTCTTGNPPVCENFADQKTCTDKGGTFVQGAKCPMNCCAWDWDLVDTRLYRAFYKCQASANLSENDCKKLVGSFSWAAATYVPHRTCVKLPASFYDSYQCVGAAD